MTPYTRSDVLALWGIQEALLQAHRRLYISAQTILISAALVLVELPETSLNTSYPLVFIVSLGIVTLVLWILIAGSRRKAVRFLQAQLLTLDAGGSVDNLYMSMQDYMNGRLQHKRSMEELNVLAASASRDILIGKLLQGLPVLFAVIWAYIIFTYWIWPLVNH